MDPFTPPQQLPRIIPADEVIPTTQRILAERKTVRNTVAKRVTPATACFKNVIQPLIDVENRTEGELGVISMLRYASPDDAAREASDEARRLMGESSAEFTAREDLYLLVKAVHDQAERYDYEAAKYLDSLLKDFTRCGHGLLDGEQIRHYLDVRNEIDRLRTEFNRNIREQNGGLWFSLSELDGVPRQDLSRLLESTDSKKEGMIFVSFRYADSQVVMKHARNPTTRKKLYIANGFELAQNIDLFKEIIVRRDENARLLGYPSHAAFRLEKRLAKTPEWVDRFLDDLETVLVPQGMQEAKALLERKKMYLADNTDHHQGHPDSLLPWDYAFYQRLALEDLHVEHEEIAEYFPLQSTVPAMLEIFTSCLQLRFVPLSPQSMVDSQWHEDVEAWSVWDDREAFRGDFIGYLYADLLWRPNKYKGEQNVNIQCGYSRDDGTRVYPATILMCSFPRPTASGCALLQHRELVTLFHELGHAIHDLLSKNSYVKLHVHGAPPDFVEAPSVMLENWCWMKDELKRMSCHYTRLDPKYLDAWRKEHPEAPLPPDKAPDGMLDNLIKSRNVTTGLWYLNQFAFARFDMAVHNPRSHDECLNLDPTSIYNDLMERLRFIPNPDPRDRGHRHASFGHVVSGYDAGYYSYLCAHVFASEIFQSTFADDPRSVTAWDRYRRGILEYGGSRDELQMLEEYLGHRPGDPGALLRRIGVL